MFQTAITEMFGVEHPIICGAMMWLSTPPLCAAISNAGGLGNLTAGNYETEEDFRAAIDETRKLTDKPFINGDSAFTMTTDIMPRPYGPVADDLEQRAEWTAEFFLRAFERAYTHLYGRTIGGIDVEVLSWTLTISAPIRSFWRASASPGSGITRQYGSLA